MGLELELVVGKEDTAPSEKEKAPKRGIDLGCLELGKEESWCEQKDWGTCYFSLVFMCSPKRGRVYCVPGAQGGTDQE